MQAEASTPKEAPSIDSAQVVRLALPDPAEIAALRSGNVHEGRSHRGLRIGFQRQLTVDPDLAPITPQSPYSQTVPGGRTLRIEVTSPEAAGMRVELRISDNFAGEVRFYPGPNAPPDSAIGPFQRNDWQGRKTYWGPVTAGETSTVELFLPRGTPSTPWRVELLSVSHLVVLPAERNQWGNIFPDTGTCEVNIACATSPDLVQAARAVAVMSFVDGGYSYVCTGSLIRDKAGSAIPYFYSSHHCVYTQTIADTLNTFWHLQDSRCTGVTDPYSARSGLYRGAIYLDSEPDNDHSLLLLRDVPPASAALLDWDTADLRPGMKVTTIHHPGSDVKKISTGFVDTPPDGSVIMSEDNGATVTHSNTWKVMWTSGVTEPGSSGAVLLTCDGSSCKLRGGLIGGSSECYRDNGPDFFSKIGLAYPRLKRWLVDAPSLSAQDCLFDWAEANHPEDFGPQHVASQYLNGYYLRYYANRNSYLGISMSESNVYYLGPKSNQGIFDLGGAATWISTASCR